MKDRRGCYWVGYIDEENPLHDQVVNCKDRTLEDTGSFGRQEFYCANKGKNAYGGGVCPAWDALDAQRASLKKS